MSDSSSNKDDLTAAEIAASEVGCETPIADYMDVFKAEFWQLVAFSMIRALIDNDDPSAVFSPNGATLRIPFQTLSSVMLECNYEIRVDEAGRTVGFNLKAPQSELQPLVPSPDDVLSTATVH